jgi:single-strand DNA-binding protein
MNKVYLIGNLTRDPEMRSTTTGVSVCNFSIAVNRRFKDADGKQQTDFFNIVAWRQLADLCGKFLMKGKKVAIFGSIQTRTYEDKTGKKCTAFDIVADEVEFLTPMGEAPGTRSTANESAPAYTPADQRFTQVDDDELPF